MKNIVLVGIMGCGKTTCGKYLAQKLQNFELLDTDLEIEKQQNLKVSQIFSQFGENYFRNLEINLVKKIVNDSNKIIATGGLAKIIQDGTDVMDAYDGLLTLKGLVLIYEKNK